MFVVVGNIFFLLSLQTLLCLFSLLFVKISPKFVGGLNAPPGTRERKTQRERERREERRVLHTWMLRSSFASFPFSSSSFRNNHPRWKSPRYPLGNSTNTPNGLSSSSSSSNEIRIDSPGWSAGYGTGGKIWLSSKVLAEYLLKQEEEEEEEEAFYNTNTRNVLELGCGTGYAGIFAAKYYEAKETKTSSLTLTDGGTEALLRLCEENARQNGIDDVLACKYEWGRGTMCSSLRERVKRFPPDLILGSDCTYERKAHEDLCESIAELLELAARGRERGKNEEAKRRGNERAKDSSSSSPLPPPRVLLAHQHRTFASLLNGRGFGPSIGLDPNYVHFLETCERKGLVCEEVHTEKLAWHGLRNVSIVSIIKSP